MCVIINTLFRSKGQREKKKKKYKSVQGRDTRKVCSRLIGRSSWFLTPNFIHSRIFLTYGTRERPQFMESSTLTVASWVSECTDIILNGSKTCFFFHERMRTDRIHYANIIPETYGGETKTRAIGYIRSSIQGRAHHIHHTLCFVFRYADARCWFVYQLEYRERSSYPFHRSAMFSIALVWEETTRALPRNLIIHLGKPYRWVYTWNPWKMKWGNVFWFVYNRKKNINSFQKLSLALRQR